MAADPAHLRVAKTVTHPGTFFSLARAGGATKLYLGNSDGKVYQADLAAEPTAFSPLAGHTSYVTGAALTSGGLVTGGYDCQLIWWDLETQQPIRTLANAHERWIRNVVATPDGQRVLSIADDMQCKVWNARTGELERTLSGHERMTPHHFPSMLYALAVSADGRFAATGDKVGHIVVWELSTGEKAAEIEAPGMYTWDPSARRHSIGGIRSLAFSPDGTRLAVGGIGRIGNIDHLDGKARVEVFVWQERRRTHELENDEVKGLVEQLLFHPDGNWLLSAGGDHNGFLVFQDLTNNRVLKTEKPQFHIHGLSFDLDTETLTVAGNGRFVIFDLKAPA